MQSLTRKSIYNVINILNKSESATPDKSINKIMQNKNATE